MRPFIHFLRRKRIDKRGDLTPPMPLNKRPAQCAGLLFSETLPRAARAPGEGFSD
jgi:hypothetical protein